jgi:hypothetical protein
MLASGALLAFEGEEDGDGEAINLCDVMCEGTTWWWGGWTTTARSGTRKRKNEIEIK